MVHAILFWLEMWILQGFTGVLHMRSLSYLYLLNRFTHKIVRASTLAKKSTNESVKHFISSLSLSVKASHTMPPTLGEVPPQGAERVANSLALTIPKIEETDVAQNSRSCNYPRGDASPK